MALCNEPSFRAFLLQYITIYNMLTIKEIEMSDIKFCIGDIVYHQTFEIGKITTVDDNINIYFHTPDKYVKIMKKNAEQYIELLYPANTPNKDFVFNKLEHYCHRLQCIHNIEIRQDLESIQEIYKGKGLEKIISFYNSKIQEHNKNINNRLEQLAKTIKIRKERSTPTGGWQYSKTWWPYKK